MICSTCRQRLAELATWRCHWCGTLHCLHVDACTCLPDRHRAPASAIIRHHVRHLQESDPARDIVGESGVNPEVFAAFMAGDDDLVPLPVLDRLISYLGLYLTTHTPGAWIT